MIYPDDLPATALASHSSDGMLLFTAVLSVFIGVILAVLGKKGKVLWLYVWSIGLVLCSITMGAYLLAQKI